MYLIVLVQFLNTGTAEVPNFHFFTVILLGVHYSDLRQILTGLSPSLDFTITYFLDFYSTHREYWSVQ